MPRVLSMVGAWMLSRLALGVSPSRTELLASPSLGRFRASCFVAPGFPRLLKCSFDAQQSRYWARPTACCLTGSPFLRPPTSGTRGLYSRGGSRGGGYLHSAPSPDAAAGSLGVDSPTAPAVIIDGRGIADKIHEQIGEEVRALQASHDVTPGLAVLLVGERTDSATYVRMKKKAAAKVGFHSVDVSLQSDVTEQELMDEVQKLNDDPRVHGILVQLPLPPHINERQVLQSIALTKDVDGFSATNIGNLCLRGGDAPLAVPCTPAGCLELLAQAGVSLPGKEAVVLGRSNIVGMPVAALLQAMDCTVTVLHSRTPDIPEKVRRADIVIAAIGKAEFVRGSWLKPGCVVIDVGINSKDDAQAKRGYRLVGDVAFDEARAVASAITPVPGGVGPMTVTMLLCNTLNLARHAVGLPPIVLRSEPG